MRKPSKSDLQAHSGLLRALFTRTQINVLGLIFTQPERQFFVSEIISLAQCGSGSVQRELIKLNDSGLIISSRLGSLKLYQANDKSPIFEEIRNIFKKSAGINQSIKEALLKLKSEISLAFVFGSSASGTDHAKSDIDLIIVSDELNLEDVYECLEPIEAKTSRKISPLIYSSFEFKKKRKAHNTFLDKVLKSPYEVLIGSIDEK